MTEKRFEVYKSKLTGLFVVNDNTHEFHFEGVENASTIMKLVGLLNELFGENKKLKQRLKLYGEYCPSGEWIIKLSKEELENELEEMI